MRNPLWVLLAATVAGCGSGTDPEAYRAEPVIVVVLTAGQPTHSLTARWSVPVDSVEVLTGDARPIAPADLNLRIDGPGGVATSPRPVADTPGAYRIDLTVLPDAQYRLAGTIAGRAVNGATTVPGPITFVAPTNGVVVLTADPVQNVRYHIRSRNAVAVAILNDNPFELPPAIGDTVGVWSFPTALFQRDTSRLSIQTHDHAAAGFLDRRFWVTNLTGALGVLGSQNVGTLLVVGR